MAKVPIADQPQQTTKKSKRVYLEMPQEMYDKLLALSKQLQFTTLNALIRNLCRERLIQAGMLDPAINTDTNTIDGD